MLQRLRFLWNIYITFLRLGSISFGGGYAMLSLMEREVVEEKKWVEKEKIVDIFAVAESLPGAIALNSSAFVGFSISGITGAVAALLGNLTSPVVIVLVLSIIYNRIKDLPAVVSAFTGIYPAIVGLILYAAYKIGKTAIRDRAGIIIALASFMLGTFLHQPPIPVILSGALAGLSLETIHTGRKQNNLLSIIRGCATLLSVLMLFAASYLFKFDITAVTLLMLGLLLANIFASLRESDMNAHAS